MPMTEYYEHTCYLITGPGLRMSLRKEVVHDIEMRKPPQLQYFQRSQHVVGGFLIPEGAPRNMFSVAGTEGFRLWSLQTPQKAQFPAKQCKVTGTIEPRS